MFFYDAVYVVLLTLVSPWVIYRFLTTPRYRVGLRQRLGAVPRRESDRPCIWIHGVSVGEILAAKSFVQQLGQVMPDWDLVISTTTDTGYQVARRTFPDRMVFFFPVDLSFAVRRALSKVRPRIVVLIELEIWPNFLALCYSGNVPVVLVNGRISARSFRGYRLVKRWLFRPLARIRMYLVQTPVYADRFRSLGVPAVQIAVTGNMKYDNMPDFDAEKRRTDVRGRLGLGDGVRLIGAGSTHGPEETWVLAAFLELARTRADLRLLLAPRHLERLGAVEDAIRSTGFRPLRWSECPTGMGCPEDTVLVLDTVGDLVSVYAACDLVFVGGSLVPHGGQNMMEPVCLGRPTVFGPYVQNFEESVRRLMEVGGAVQVADPAGLVETLGRLLDHPEEADALALRGRAAVLHDRGATKRTIEIIRDMLSNTPVRT